MRKAGAGTDREPRGRRGLWGGVASRFPRDLVDSKELG